MASWPVKANSHHRDVDRGEASCRLQRLTKGQCPIGNAQSRMKFARGCRERGLVKGRRQQIEVTGLGRTCPSKDRMACRKDGMQRVKIFARSQAPDDANSHVLCLFCQHCRMTRRGRVPGPERTSRLRCRSIAPPDTARVENGTEDHHPSTSPESRSTSGPP